MSLRLTHTFDDCIEVAHQDQMLFRYVYRPRTASIEAPKPHFHPVSTLAGHTVTAFRPHDHVWHHGLTMTAPNLSGQNFWGGSSYVRDQGYVPLNNVGTIEHDRWTELGGPTMRERLRWRTASGEAWLEEDRTIVLGDVDTQRGVWRLDLGFALRNVVDRTLEFSSPTIEGRRLAGYGGLFWRGPRSFADGTILADSDQSGPEMMGRRARWLAYVGQHDEVDASSTLLFMDHPTNPRYPTKWFVRAQPYACVSFAFAFDERLSLGAGQTLDLRYSIAVADGAWSTEQAGAYASTVT